MNSKRIQFHHRTKDGRCEKVWQRIDAKRMITLQDAWNDLKHQWISKDSSKQHRFFSTKMKQNLPDWFHLDLLNDHDEIIIEQINENPSNSTIDLESVKIISKKNQLKASITNRSFIITNKHFIPATFYQQWKDGLTHLETKNCRIVY